MTSKAPASARTNAVAVRSADCALVAVDVAIDGADDTATADETGRRECRLAFVVAVGAVPVDDVVVV
ncbi:MAG TPA: hypothetical protein VLS45_04850, partial [Methylomicrobium sp.]|nr:hypothetical protein [Methylomicrobium sp.]